MNKLDLLYGFIIGIAMALLGAYLFIEVFTDYNYHYGLIIIRSNGDLGKLIALGAMINLGLFFILLKFKKDLMARGVVLATIILTLATLFV